MILRRYIGEKNQLVGKIGRLYTLSGDDAPVDLQPEETVMASFQEYAGELFGPLPASDFEDPNAEDAWPIVATVPSSKGDRSYTLRRSPAGWFSCECLGFKHRFKCRHVREYVEAQAAADNVIPF